MDTCDTTSLVKDDDLEQQYNIQRRNSHEDEESTSTTIEYDNDNVQNRINLNIPEDKYNYTYLVFYILGMATLLPWNFFITAEDYWLYKFRNVSFPNATELTPIQKSFTSDLSISASIPGTIFLIINAIIGHLISLRMKMVGSMIGILILFIATTIFIEINTDNWQNGFFVLTIMIVVIMNSFSAVLSGALFGIAGLFPSDYMTAVVSGQALGGIFTALAMIISLTFGMNPEITALVYFNVGNTVLIISIIAYILMAHTKFFRYFVIEEREHKNDDSENTEIITNENIQNPEFLTVFKKIHVYALSEFLVFAITLSVYPSLTVLVQSQYHGNGHPWNDIYFVPVVNYLTFNSGDYLGRIIAGVFERPRNKPYLVICFTLLRATFIPILMMTNLNDDHHLPVIVHSDIAFICIMSIFAITNGYFANISLILAPKVVMQHEKELASSIMAACLGLGLTTGSAISLVLVQLL